jgi:hypothetical protein
MNPKTKVLYDYEFLRIVKIKTEAGTSFTDRHLSFGDPSRATHIEQFSLLSQALASVQEIIELEERYAVPVEIPALSEAARERLDGEPPKLFAVDPEKLLQAHESLGKDNL